MKFSAELESLINIVEMGGEIAKMARKSNLEVEDITGKGLVTTGDRMVNDAIIAAIKIKFPDNISLTEEGLNNPSMDDLREERVVILDPIDGTRWYKDGGDLWSVTSALVINNQLTACATLRPDTDELWVAENQRGAHYRNYEHLWFPIHTLDLKDLSKAKIGVGGNMSTLKGRKEIERFFLTLLTESRGPYIMASTALELAWVAQGLVLGGDIHPAAKPWDKAAGMLLINEAGGKASGWPGRENIFGDGLIAAANPKVYEELYKMVTE